MSKKTRQECGQTRYSFEDARKWAEIFESEGTLKAVKEICGVDPGTARKWFANYAGELQVSLPRIELRKGIEVRCSRCKKYKQENEDNFYFFAKDDRLSSACKDCTRDRAAKRYETKKIEINEAQKEYAKNNFEKMSEYKRKSAEKNKEKNRKRTAEKKKNDLIYRLKCNLRSRLATAIKSGRKPGSAVRDLGCSMDFFKEHLTSKFHADPRTGEKMTWENYGKWHVDHIFPLFRCNTKEEVLRACHYTNLQPLWAHENLVKRAKILDGVKLP